MPPRPLRILCFGDSLTEGYSQYGLSFTPYSTTLQKRLQESLGEQEVEIRTDGMSGQAVTGGFLRRMKRHYNPSQQERYDIVVFLGGTNDIGRGLKAGEVYAVIREITDLCLGNGANVLLLTVPECGVVEQGLDGRRKELNELILRDERASVHTLDLFNKMPYHSLSPAEREEIWDDGLHFTPAGYERLGNFVAVRILEILSGQEKEGKAE